MNSLSVPVVVRIEGLEKLPLKPEEAFVFSRINGKASIEEISSILALDVEQVILHLSIFVKEGFVRVDGPAEAKAAVVKKNSPSLLEQLDVEDKDPEISKLSRAVRMQIHQQWELCQKENPHERFGLSPTVGKDQIKKRYYELVKQFHPDRYYGRAHGGYEAKLNFIFEKMTLTLEELTGSPQKNKPVAEPTSTKTGTQYRVEQKFQSMIKMAEKEESNKNYKAALNFYQLALSLAPNHEDVKKALRRVTDKLNK